MNRPSPDTAALHATGRTHLLEIGVVALVCGPATTGEDIANLRLLGDRWHKALNTWESSGAPYCLLVANQGGATEPEPFACPATFMTADVRLLEQAIWAAISSASGKRVVLDSLDPSMDHYVAIVKSACMHRPGHA